MQLTLPSILVRVSAMFVIALVIIRLSGKQSVGDLSTMDFIVTMILGDAFDTIIYGEQPILVGVVYFVTIALIHVLVCALSSRNRLFFRLTTSPATLMVHNGRVQGNGLAGERMRAEDIASNMRERGEDQLEKVKEAWLEPNGKLSVVRQISSKTVQKQDIKTPG